MLKGVDSRLNTDVLAFLQVMGYGDVPSLDTFVDDSVG